MSKGADWDRVLKVLSSRGRREQVSAKDEQAGADWLGKTLSAKQGLEDLMQSGCEGEKAGWGRNTERSTVQTTKSQKKRKAWQDHKREKKMKVRHKNPWVTGNDQEHDDKRQ